MSTTSSERRQIAGIAVPVSLEFMLILVLNFINQVIVGVLGATAIAAVGFANSIIFVLVLTFGALGISVSILVARAFGGGRRSEMSHTVTAALLMSGALIEYNGDRWLGVHPLARDYLTELGLDVGAV